MVSGIKHHTTTTHPNSTDYDVSKSAWEENHDIDDAGIPQAKLAADIQVIGGPAWSNPTGSGPFVIQYNTGIALTRFCWFNGTVWDYIWGGNCRIKDFIVSSGTVTVNDCVFNTDVAGTALPQVYRATSAGNVGGIALATVVAPGTVPVLLHGPVLLAGGGTITAGRALYGADASARLLSLFDQNVNESGSGNYTIYYNRRTGIALTTCTGAGASFWALINR